MGIGLAIAREYLELGAEVLVIARNTKTILGKLKNSANLFTYEGDLNNADFRNDLVNRVSENWGKLDVLVNNVGTNIRKKFVDYHEEEIRQLFETNLFCMMELTHACYPLLKKSGHASVINMASVAGMVDVQSGPPYGMTKALLLFSLRAISRLSGVLIRFVLMLFHRGTLKPRLRNRFSLNRKGLKKFLRAHR